MTPTDTRTWHRNKTNQWNARQMLTRWQDNMATIVHTGLGYHNDVYICKSLVDSPKTHRLPADTNDVDTADDVLSTIWLTY